MSRTIQSILRFSFRHLGNLVCHVLHHSLAALVVWQLHERADDDRERQNGRGFNCCFYGVGFGTALHFDGCFHFFFLGLSHHGLLHFGHLVTSVFLVTQQWP